LRKLPGNLVFLRLYDKSATNLSVRYMCLMFFGNGFNVRTYFRETNLHFRKTYFRETNLHFRRTYFRETNPHNPSLSRRRGRIQYKRIGQIDAYFLLLPLTAKCPAEMSRNDE